MRSYEEASASHTVMGKVKVSVYGEGNQVKTTKPFGGAQPERTQAEKDEIAAMLAQWNTPEVKKKAQEYAERHEHDDNYDEDF